MRALVSTLLLAALLAPAAVWAQTAPAAAASAAPTHYSTDATDLGSLLDDPAAKAVLAKLIPSIVNSDQIDMARSMTLKSLQTYSPDNLTDRVLADIDSEFAKLPPKK